MIADNVRGLLSELPAGIDLVAAAKGRSAAEVMQAVQAGVTAIGENFVQEAEAHQDIIGRGVAWHFIGALQQNKARAAVRLFDVIETVDSLALAQAIDRHSAALAKVMPVLLEINSGREPQKSGVLPEDAESLIRNVSRLNNIHIVGLMTMGPRAGDPEEARPCFAATRRLFERLAGLKLPNVNMKHLSMGMTNSYRVAIQEGANIVRIGSKIFNETG